MKLGEATSSLVSEIFRAIEGIYTFVCAVYCIIFTHKSIKQDDDDFSVSNS